MVLAGPSADYSDHPRFADGHDARIVANRVDRGTFWFLESRSQFSGTCRRQWAQPYLLAQLPAGTRALALRVSAKTSKGAEAAYLNAIGPA